ncbi:MAG: translation initiation factor 2 [Clostridiales bacterium]|nr:translation initiation factor 2 [Clostridiales bacterium]
MVKGISRRVIVVKSPEPKLFEQAIFLLRENILPGEGGVTSDQILAEAHRVADSYLRRNTAWSRRRQLLLPLFWGVCGAVLSSAAWCAILFIQ